MASIQDRRGEGRGWRVQYRDPDGRMRNRSFAKWADADTFAVGRDGQASRRVSGPALGVCC